MNTVVIVLKPPYSIQHTYL